MRDYSKCTIAELRITIMDLDDQRTALDEERREARRTLRRKEQDAEVRGMWTGVQEQAGTFAVVA